MTRAWVPATDYFVIYIYFSYLFTGDYSERTREIQHVITCFLLHLLQFICLCIFNIYLQETTVKRL